MDEYDEIKDSCPYHTKLDEMRWIKIEVEKIIQFSNKSNEMK